MKIDSFKDLVVWQKSMDLVEEIYQITGKLPARENFGLASQLQRASVSIASNIAEGSRRSSGIHYRQFCIVSVGSASELETQLMIVARIYPGISVEKAIEHTQEIQKMLSSLINKLRAVPQS